MYPTVKIFSSGNKAQNNLRESLSALTKKSVLVGIPATSLQERQRQVQQILISARGARAKRRAQQKETLNNAELLYIHSNGSPVRGIPARPVIEPAISDPTNTQNITAELGLAAKAALDGDAAGVSRELKLAGTVAENASRAWFVNPRNGWAPNKPATIKRKGSSRPLIDTGALRKALTHVIVED